MKIARGRSWFNLFINASFFIFQCNSCLQLQCAADVQNSESCLSGWVISGDTTTCSRSRQDYLNCAGVTLLWLFTESRHWTSLHRSWEDKPVVLEKCYSEPQKAWAAALLVVVSVRKQSCVRVRAVIDDFPVQCFVQVDSPVLQTGHIRGLYITRGDEHQDETAYATVKLYMNFTDLDSFLLVHGNKCFCETNKGWLGNQTLLLARTRYSRLIKRAWSNFCMRQYLVSFERWYVFHGWGNAVMLRLVDKEGDKSVLENTDVVASVIPNCQRQLSKKRNLCSPSGNPQERDDTTTVVIVSDIVSISVHPYQARELRTSVHLTFRLLFAETRQEGAQCVFWDMAFQRWSREGCHTVYSNLSHAHCHCDHLSSFAVLVNVMKGPALARDNPQQVLTMIGCVGSSVCFLLVYFTFTFFEEFRSARTNLHRNLAALLFIATVFFLLTNAFRDSPNLCLLTGMATHYLYLSAFCWMQMEGVNLLILFACPYSSRPRSWTTQSKTQTIACTVTPVLIMGTTLVVANDYCYTSGYCWLSSDNGCIWGFVAPVLFVSFINTFAFLCSVYTMIKHSLSSKSMRHRSMMYKILLWVKGAALLLSILGIPWTIGIFDFGQNTTVFSYLFILFNSTQGIFMFFSRCISSDKVRSKYISLMLTNPYLPSCIRSYLEKIHENSHRAIYGKSSEPVQGTSLQRKPEDDIDPFRVLFPESYPGDRNSREDKETEEDDSSSSDDTPENLSAHEKKPSQVPESPRYLAWESWYTHYVQAFVRSSLGETDIFPGGTLSKTASTSHALQQTQTVLNVLDFAFEQDMLHHEEEVKPVFSFGLLKHFTRKGKKKSAIENPKDKMKDVKTEITPAEKSLSRTMFTIWRSRKASTKRIPKASTSKPQVTETLRSSPSKTLSYTLVKKTTSSGGVHQKHAAAFTRLWRSTSKTSSPNTNTLHSTAVKSKKRGRKAAEKETAAHAKTAPETGIKKMKENEETQRVVPTLSSFETDPNKDISLFPAHSLDTIGTKHLIFGQRFSETDIHLSTSNHQQDNNHLETGHHVHGKKRNKEQIPSNSKNTTGKDAVQPMSSDTLHHRSSPEADRNSIQARPVSKSERRRAQEPTAEPDSDNESHLESVFPDLHTREPDFESDSQLESLIHGFSTAEPDFESDSELEAWVPGYLSYIAGKKGYASSSSVREPGKFAQGSQKGMRGGKGLNPTPTAKEENGGGVIPGSSKHSP